MYWSPFCLFFRRCSVEALHLLKFVVQLKWHGYVVMFLPGNLLFVCERARVLLGVKLCILLSSDKALYCVAFPFDLITASALICSFVLLLLPKAFIQYFFSLSASLMLLFFNIVLLQGWRCCEMESTLIWCNVQKRT